MNNKNIFRYISIVFIILETFSILRGYILIRDWIPMSGYIILAIILYPQSFINRQTIFLLLYICIVMLFFINGQSKINVTWTASEILIPLSCLAMNNVFFYNRDYDGLKLVTIIGIIIIILMSIFTIPIANTHPDAVRNMVFYSFQKDYSSIQKWYRSGLITFSAVHAIPFLFPILGSRFKMSNTLPKKLLYISLIIIPYIMIMKTNFFIPIIIANVALIISIIISEKNSITMFICITLVVIIFLIFNTGIIINILFYLKSQPLFANMGYKITDIVNTIQFGKMEGHLKLRNNIYKISWESFLESPFIGNIYSTRNGGHSFFIDRLAYFGVIGLFPYILFLYFTFLRSYILMYSQIKKYFFFVILLFLWLGFTKDISGIEYMLYLIIFIPGISINTTLLNSTLINRIKNSKIKFSFNGLKEN